MKCLLLFYATRNCFLVGLWHVMKSGFYTTDNNQFSDWTEKKLQSTAQSLNLHQKKVMVTVWWSAAHLIHYNFLDPGETIVSEKYAQQVESNIKNCSACNWHWSTERAQFFSRIMPGYILHNQRFKSWMNWATGFCLICHIHLSSHQHTSTFSSISTTFCRDNASECAADPETDWYRIWIWIWGMEGSRKKKVDRKENMMDV